MKAITTMSNTRKRKLVTDMVVKGTYTNKEIVDAIGVTNRFVNKIKQEQRGAPKFDKKTYTVAQRARLVRRFRKLRKNEGYSIEEAADICGVVSTTLYAWHRAAP